MLTCVSLTGPDDKTDIDELARMAERFPFVEWALLYVPHNEGAPRNPTRAWREAFFNAEVKGSSAVHLCGSQAFNELLTGTLPADILRADRLQLNVNARRREFSVQQVLDIYRRSLELGPDIILQRHADTADLIDQFLSGLTADEAERVHVLLDESKGTGLAPASWQRPESLEGVYCGFAGGVAPHNVGVTLTLLRGIHARDEPWWVDMESGIRTDNELDMAKAQAVLEAAQSLLSR